MQEHHTHSASEKSTPEKAADLLEAVDQINELRTYANILMLASSGFCDREDSNAIAQISADILKRSCAALEALHPGEKLSAGLPDQISECSIRLRHLLEKRHLNSKVTTSIVECEDSGPTVYMFEVHHLGGRA